MNRTDLYLIKGSTFSDQVNFCCRLVEKALVQNIQVHIQTAEAAHNELLKDALWTFKAESFLPSTIGLTTQQQDYSITIDSRSFSPDDINGTDLLILLTTELPDHCESVARMSLVVANQDQALRSARTHYRQLKGRGVDVHIHDLRG